MMDCRRATRDEVGLMLDWAADEGWNPGIDDAAAFYAADPDGFLVLTDQNKPIASISVVRQGETEFGDAYGFLGLYLCTPRYRGMGHGWRIWQAGMDLLGDSVVALDGVVEQQANYQKSGFELAYRNVRFTGAAAPILSESLSDTEISIRDVDPSDIHALIEMDAEAGGVHRDRYLSHWLTGCETRFSVLAESNENESSPVGFATIRRCREHFKVGPLLAPDTATATALLRRLVELAGADVITWDIPEPNTAAMKMASGLGLEAVFETARMYKGRAPSPDLNRVYGVATLELG